MMCLGILILSTDLVECKSIDDLAELCFLGKETRVCLGSDGYVVSSPKYGEQLSYAIREQSLVRHEDGLRQVKATPWG